MTKREKQKKTQEQQAQVCLAVDKAALVMKLGALAEESGDIAGYISDTVQYGRALGYAEGKHAAYRELAHRVLGGEFDPFVEGGEDGYAV